ncbi:acyltransferase [Amycolatopsis acidiphila]|uniref:Acyltransferase n=1 Tax=Amycolatopsis acidiphila TaxID=715473 RepID=A0A558ALI0_9PSEU|nr:acyltransferase [Amycolatopsis acidiphila]
MTALRRAVMIPVVVLVEVFLLLTAPLSLAVAGLTSVCARSSRPLRTALLVLAYAGVELRVLRRILGGEPDWDALMSEVIDTIYRTLRLVLDVRLVLEAGSPAAGRPAAGNPVIVLARHCGPGDSLFIAWLIAVHYRLRLHIVLKALLRLEPTLDLAGDHVPLCFVARRGRRARDDIGALAASLSHGDALLLFPEGGNFSRPRWRRAVAALFAGGALGAARRARRRTHTLPPHRGGTVAALTNAPGADVLLLTHTGFSDDGRDRPWWRLPVHRTVVVRTELIPAAQVPREPEAAGSWLEHRWAEVDAWVADHSTAR